MYALTFHYYYLLLTIMTFTNLLLHARLLLLFNKLYCTVLYCIVINQSINQISKQTVYWPSVHSGLQQYTYQ